MSTSPLLHPGHFTPEASAHYDLRQEKEAQEQNGQIKQLQARRLGNGSPFVPVPSPCVGSSNSADTRTPSSLSPDLASSPGSGSNTPSRIFLTATPPPNAQLALQRGESVGTKGLERERRRLAEKHENYAMDLAEEIRLIQSARNHWKRNFLLCCCFGPSRPDLEIEAQRLNALNQQLARYQKSAEELQHLADATRSAFEPFNS